MSFCLSDEIFAIRLSDFEWTMMVKLSLKWSDGFAGQKNNSLNDYFGWAVIDFWQHIRPLSNPYAIVIVFQPKPIHKRISLFMLLM